MQLCFTMDQVIRASPRICICDVCAVEYGSCELFQEYDLCPLPVKAPSKRSTLQSPAEPEERGKRSPINYFLLEGSICAVAPSESSRDPVWFMKIQNHTTAAGDRVDDSGMNVLQGRNI